MICIIDYGMGNLGSILHKMKQITTDVKLSADIADIEAADKIVLPGVGSYATGIRNLKSIGLIDPLNRKVLIEKTPILGICLGMQLFSDHGDEGDADGLGWIKGRTVRFDFTGRELMHIPHVGWNQVKIKKPTNLFEGIPQEYKFYFTHSYHLRCSEEDVLATTEYGYEFVSAIKKENILGYQFHPEKSHLTGVTLIKNFIKKM